MTAELDQEDPTWRGAETGILRFTIEIFVYKWLLLDIEKIISRNYLSVFIKLLYIYGYH